jgi:hypothetical protein
LDEVCSWLGSLNLGKYAPNFKENAIDGSCLKVGLDDQTLDAIGVQLPVHRKKLQSACSDLFGAATAAPPKTPEPSISHDPCNLC